MIEPKYSTGKPPFNLYNKCKETFGFKLKWEDGLVITYEDTVYSSVPLSEDLQIHEATHIKQQTEMGAEIWWSKYLIDKEFRLSQELEAYQNQWDFIKKNYNRQNRKYLFKHITKSMADLYGGMCTEQEAISLLK